MSGSFVFFAAADRGSLCFASRQLVLCFSAACALQVCIVIIFSTRNIVADVRKIEDGKDRLPLVPRSAAANISNERLARVASFPTSHVHAAS